VLVNLFLSEKVRLFFCVKYVPLRELCFALTNSLKFKYFGRLLLALLAIPTVPFGCD